MVQKTFLITLDSKAQEKLSKIRSIFGLNSEQGALILAISLATELSDCIDDDGCLTLRNSTKIKVRDGQKSLT